MSWSRRNTEASKWLVEEILSIMNTLDLAALHENLAFTKRQGQPSRATEDERLLFAKDPYVYFYEDFLKAYDKATRKARGVYYTPPPVVNFIVRAVNDILKDSFGIGHGLADRRRVTVLDFATGTGTFLLEVLHQIFETVSEGVRAQVVKEHVLKNLYGFEYLIAPYTVAHLKLSQFLHNRGYAMRRGERLNIYLTNTLEPIEPQGNLLLPALSDEVKAAQAVKEKPILVITGNPPYSGHSKNTGAWITGLIDTYKTVDGKPLGEKNPKWLQDDYVKFIRFAQWKIEQVEEGVVRHHHQSLLSGQPDFSRDAPIPDADLQSDVRARPARQRQEERAHPGGRQGRKRVRHRTGRSGLPAGQEARAVSGCVSR